MTEAHTNQSFRSGTSRLGKWTVLLVSLMAAANARVSAQSNPVTEKRNNLSIEANPFRGTVSYTRVTSPRWEFGVSGGFGFPQIDQTLTSKNGNDFRDYLHIGGIARSNFANEHALVEAGVRVGFADYQQCLASDCWPQVYYGPSVLVAVGGRRVKVGTRVTAGFIFGSGHDLDTFASVAPANLLLSFRF